MSETAIDRGLELVRRACDDRRWASDAQQMLRNWQHRLERVTVLDGALRREVLDHIQALTQLLDDLHTGDPVLFARRYGEVRDRLEPLHRGLISLIGARGMD